MTEQIKYEAVFGDQSLLEKESDDVVAVRFNDYTNRCYPITKDKLLSLTFTDLKVIPIVALRRIIRTPVWTKQDQKAGKLPEVSCKVECIKSGDDHEVLIKTSAVIVTFNHYTQEAHTIPIADFCDYFKPVETEAERQQREEDEFVSSINVDDYSPLLSGVAFKTGVRAAYRKLKMPEVKK